MGAEACCVSAALCKDSCTGLRRSPKDSPLSYNMRHWSSKKIHVVSVPTVGLCVCPWLDLSAVKTLKTLSVPLDIRRFEVSGSVVLPALVQMFVSVEQMFLFHGVHRTLRIKELRLSNRILEGGWGDLKWTLGLPKYLDKVVGTKRKHPFWNYSHRIGRVTFWTLKYLFLCYKQLLSAWITCILFFALSFDVTGYALCRSCK